MIPGSFYVARIFSMGDHESLSVTQHLKCDLRSTANSLLSLVKGFRKANLVNKMSKSLRSVSSVTSQLCGCLGGVSKEKLRN